MINKRTKIIVVIVIAVTVIVAALLWFTRRRLQYESAPMTTENRAISNENRALEKEKAVGKVQIEMERVIDNWCRAEAGSYGPEDTLKGLWMRRFPTTPKYRPKGINNLIEGIRENEFFRNCNPPHIEFGAFVEGGAIQKVGDLMDFLNPCEQAGD